MKLSFRRTTSKSRIVLTCGLILFFCLISVIQTVSAAETSTAVVTVNGKAMDQAELDKQLNRILNTAKGQLPEEQLEKIKGSMQKQIIEHFITKTLLSAECDRLNITVTDKDLEDKLDTYKARLPKGMTLESALQQGGVSMEEMKDNISFSLKVEKLVELKTKDNPKPSEEDIKKYFETNKKQFSSPEKVHARHILIKIDKADDEKTKKEKKDKINSLREQLLKGADFEQLAKEHSDCPSGKSKGGDLGTFPRGRMVKEFEEAAFSQKVNEIGPVVETKFGYHIIQVLGKTEASSKTLEESKDNIINRIQQKDKSKVTGELIKSLREKAKIVYADPYNPEKK